MIKSDHKNVLQGETKSIKSTLSLKLAMNICINLSLLVACFFLCLHPIPFVVLAEWNDCELPSAFCIFHWLKSVSVVWGAILFTHVFRWENNLEIFLKWKFVWNLFYANISIWKSLHWKYLYLYYQEISC